VSAGGRGERDVFKLVLASIALAAGMVGTGLLFFVPIPEGNREPLLLALGLVMGWGSTVINYEFGSSPAGRRAAEAGTRPPPPGPGGE
jgi:uncharacterized RDD family membrane protein YckC